MYCLEKSKTTSKGLQTIYGILTDVIIHAIGQAWQTSLQQRVLPPHIFAVFWKACWATLFATAARALSCNLTFEESHPYFRALGLFNAIAMHKLPWLCILKGSFEQHFEGRPFSNECRGMKIANDWCHMMNRSVWIVPCTVWHDFRTLGCARETPDLAWKRFAATLCTWVSCSETYICQWEFKAVLLAKGTLHLELCGSGYVVWNVATPANVQFIFPPADCTWYAFHSSPTLVLHCN